LHIMITQNMKKSLNIPHNVLSPIFPNLPLFATIVS
jgi:hypothetical protein